MVMTEIQSVRKFEVKVPIALWERWEQWIEGRGSLTNPQIMCGLLKLFLASEEPAQLQALAHKWSLIALARRAIQ
jgi:hypothetical protein